MTIAIRTGGALVSTRNVSYPVYMLHGTGVAPTIAEHLPMGDRTVAEHSRPDRAADQGTSARPTICFYDLDRTVTRFPTWSWFLVRTMLRHRPWRVAMIPVVMIAAIGRAIGWVGRDRIKEMMHGALIGRATPLAVIDRWADRFADHVVANGIRPGALKQIAADRAAGHRIVLATAAHRFYAEPIARRLGISDVIATEAVWSGNRVTNRLAGANVYGGAKLAAVGAWLAGQGLAREDLAVHFYSDHASDAPCLAFADRAVAVNGDRSMRALAGRHGWTSIDWNLTTAVTA